MVQQVLKPNGDLVAEVFRSAGFDQYLADVRTSFTKVVTCKPDSSRIWSREADIAGLVKKRRE
ncbi:SAM-dependent methyltransferase [Neptunomonas sp. XY-337]|uniref:SAM-dependent methyltransferase n=1 Tax=Neptunomonas sp. XY-337 TaxID=2561897 RepID=UPI001F0CE526|nr:SAM-dependent methyltransferase [Neptunomonas sp. XY-337]